MRHAIFSMVLFLAALDTSASASAKEGGSHVCPPRNPPAAPARPQGSTVTVPSGESQMVMGCLERDYPLARISLQGAKRAVAIVEEPGSIAALFAYRTSSERETLIRNWMHRWTHESFIAPKPSTFFMADRANASWRLPDGTDVHAIYPEAGEAATLCIVRADGKALRDALPVLNNWCIDRLRLWRKD